MDFAEYQQQLADLERERGWDRVLPSHTFLHMGEEMGEIARILECFEGYRGTSLTRVELCKVLSGELADLAAFIFKLASQYGISVDEAMQAHLSRFRSRYENVQEGQDEMVRYIDRQRENMNWICGA